MNNIKKMRCKKISILVILLLVLLCMRPVSVYAQSNDELVVPQDDSEEFPEDPGETDVPFDGGMYLFITVAVAYGIHRNKKRYDDTKISLEK